MATSQKVTAHFLTCSVCMEIFIDPCTLSCYHTFCRKCVVSFTNTQPEAQKAKSIPCPFCGSLTKVPDPGRSVEEWAQELKPSFMIQGLMDSFGPGTKDTDNCAYCKGEGKTTPATAWCSICDESLCEQCVKTHNRVPSFRNHNVAETSDEIKAKRKRKVMCKEHNTECVEFLCKDCKKAICHKCCIIYHRKCDSVVTIESELASMKSKLTRHKEILQEKHKHTKTNLEKKRSGVDEVRKMQSETVSQIKSACQKARDVINAKEKKLLDELAEQTDHQIGYLRADIKTGEMAVQMYQQQAELIDQAVKSDCEMDVYETYQSCATETTPGTVTVQPERRTITGIAYNGNIDVFIKGLDLLQLGEIKVVYESGLNLHVTPVLQDTIDVRVSSDLHQPYPADITVLDVNGIETVVVTDWYYNKSVTSFYNRNNQQCHSKLSLDDDAWGVTQWKDNTVVVTVPAKKQIVTVGVNPDLNLLSTIRTQKQYWGITALTPSTMAVSSVTSPPSVDILDMKGNVIRSLTPQINNNVILKDPKFLCSTQNGNILVSDRETKSVVCLTPQGDVVFNYSPTGNRELRNPRGVTVTDKGNILVTDSPLNSVLHLTKSGQFVRNILTSRDGIACPYGLFIDKRGRLYVCLYQEETIKIFSCIG